jgi:CBS domain-containing protein
MDAAGRRNDVRGSAGARRTRGRAYDCVVIVDAARRPLGIVTEGDAIRRVLADEVPGGSYLRTILASPEAAIRHLREAERAQRHTAADIMTAPVQTVAPTDNLLAVARLFQSSTVRQLVVVVDGAVAGIITRRDLVRAVLDQHAQAERALDRERDV